MINFLNEALRQLFVARINDIADVSQVSFEFPEEEFRNHVKTQGKNVLNVFLVDLRENRTTLATGMPPKSQGQPESSGGALRRVDCHYLISAWSPATRNVEPSFDEHVLLYKAIAALMDAEPLVLSKIYGSLPLPKNFPAILRDAQLPTVVLPMERFPRIAEFWMASKGGLWKPTIHLVVTLPVAPDNPETTPGSRLRG